MIMTMRSNGHRNLVSGDIFTFVKPGDDVEMHLVLAVTTVWEFGTLYEIITYTEGARFTSYKSGALLPMVRVKLLIEAEQSAVQTNSA